MNPVEIPAEIEIAEVEMRPTHTVHHCLCGWTGPVGGVLVTPEMLGIHEHVWPDGCRTASDRPADHAEFHDLLDRIRAFQASSAAFPAPAPDA